MGYITEYIVHLAEDVSKMKFLNDLTSLDKIDREDSNIISYEGYEFYIYLQKIYNTKSNKSYLIVKTYLQEDIDENNEIEEIDRLSKINEIDFRDKPKYKDKFKYFLKLQGIIKNLFREKQMGYIEKNKIECIRDDYSFILLKKSYPIIYEIENLMRKLIVKLMYSHANENWQKNEIPTNIKISSDREEQHILGSDFSHLSDMLFTPIEMNSNQQLYDFIRQIKCQDNIDCKELKRLVPKSNWDKYFSDLIINKDDEKLKKLLENLRIIRNMVAHNRVQVEYKFYEKLVEYSDEIIEMILNAISSLDTVIQKNAEENAIKKLFNNKNIPYKKFLKYYCVMEYRLYQKYQSEFIGEKIPKNFILKLKNKLEDEMDTDIFLKDITDVMYFRNNLVYENIEPKPTTREVKKQIKEIRKIIKNIDSLPKIEENNDDDIDDNIEPEF